METQWTGRVVTDTRGDHPEDWLHDYYEIAAEYLYAAAYEN